MASIKVNGANSTVIFDYTQPTKILTDTLTDAAELLYQATESSKTRPFIELTNLEKLTVVSNYIKSEILKMAAIQNRLRSTRTAAATSDEESKSKYDL